MAKNTSISLDDHFQGFIEQQCASGRYGSASEVIRAGLRLLEERKRIIGGLRGALIDGERSSDVGEPDIKVKGRGVAGSKIRHLTGQPSYLAPLPSR